MKLKKRISKKPQGLQNCLVCGDSLDFMKSLPDKSVDLIVTDPPYEVALDGGGTINKVKRLNSSLVQLSDGVVDLSKGYNIELFGEEFLRICKTPNIYIWCNKAQIPRYLDFYVTKHKCKFEIICWHKTNALPTYSHKYLSDTEYCLYFHIGKCNPSSYEDAKTSYIAPINHTDKKTWNHPTIKPLPIIERFIRNSSEEGDLVFDPFVGSGTTCVASKKLGRKYLACEIDPNHFETAKNRIESLA